MRIRRSLSEKQKKVLTACLIGMAVSIAIAFAAAVSGPLVRFAAEPEKFRGWVEARGVWGRLSYVGVVILQVVFALIPGEPFELAAGYAFGAWEGTVLCLLAGTIGSMLVFFAVRKWGMRLVKVFFEEEKVKKLKFLQSTPGRDFLFLFIFMLPGTPKDLLCYFAGLTDIRPWKWLFIASVGRLPAILTSTLGGDALGTRNYLTAGIVFAVTLLISGGGLLLYRIILKRHDKPQ